MPERLNVLVTMPFDEAKLDRMRAVSPRLTVTRATAETADYAQADVLYAVTVPDDLVGGGKVPRAPRLKWVQVHMAGVNTLHDHPLYTRSEVLLTTSSGVHAAVIAEYAITMLLALAHRVSRAERPCPRHRLPVAEGVVLVRLLVRARGACRAATQPSHRVVDVVVQPDVGDVPPAVGMVIVVGRPIAGGITVTARQQTADSARAFQAAGEVAAPGVADGRRVVQIPLLDHPPPIVQIASFTGNNPTGAVIG